MSFSSISSDIRICLDKFVFNLDKFVFDSFRYSVEQAVRFGINGPIWYSYAPVPGDAIRYNGEKFDINFFLCFQDAL